MSGIPYDASEAVAELRPDKQREGLLGKYLVRGTIVWRDALVHPVLFETILIANIFLCAEKVHFSGRCKGQIKLFIAKKRTQKLQLQERTDVLTFCP